MALRSQTQRTFLLGFIASIAACGTVAVPILHRVSAVRVQDETHTADLSATVKLACPLRQ